MKTSLPRRLAPAVLASIFLASTRPVRAGMPYFPLTEFPQGNRGTGYFSLSTLSRQRIEAISFFLLAILICAWVVQRIWNGLRTDSPRLPRLSLGKALGLVTLWGLLFVLILTMISGARELLTPGAWKRDGSTYKIVPEPAPPPPTISPDEARRRESLARLWNAIQARTHGDGREVPTLAQLPADVLKIRGHPDETLVYVEGVNDDQFDSIVAAEPRSFGAFRLVLLYGGDVRLMPDHWIEREFADRRR